MKKQKQVRPVLMRNRRQEKYKVCADERVVDYEVELHWHDYIEIELVIEGGGYQIFNGKQTPFEHGVVSVFRQSDYHYFLPQPSVTLLNFSFNPSIIDEALLRRLEAAPSRICTKLSEQDYTVIQTLMRLAVTEYNRENLDTTYMAALIECIFIKLLGLEMFNTPTASTFPVQQAIFYMRSHFMEDPSLDSVAKMLHYHPKHFCSLFRKEVGLKYSEYLAKLKITYAKTLLRITELDMEQICSSCGFGSMVNFRRVFKEAVGVTPLQYRKNAKS